MDHEIDIVLHVPVGETRSVRWLAQHFGVAQNTLSAKVKSLEERGYLRRRRDPTDKRRWLVELTAQGRHVVASYTLFELEELSEALGALDSDERRRLVELLERLSAKATELAARSQRIPPTGYMALHRGFPSARALAAARRGGHGQPQPRGWDRLTPAQRNVAELVRQGLTNAEIAERLGVSRRTVESHLRQIYDKLNISSRTRLAHLAWTAENS